MSRTTIAIDIDGTIRDLEGQIVKYVELDYPEMLDNVRKRLGHEYYCLNPDEFKTGYDGLQQWMYDERVFELFGMAQRTHPKVIEDLNLFTLAAEKSGYEVWIASVQKNRSITATLHWLAKWGCRVPRIRFFPTMDMKVEHDFDIYVDDCPDVIAKISEPLWREVNHPEVGRCQVSVPRAIKVPYKFTKEFDVPEVDIVNGKFNDLYDILGIEKILFTE